MRNCCGSRESDEVEIVSGSTKQRSRPLSSIGLLQGREWPALPDKKPAPRQVRWAGDVSPGARQTQRTTQRAPVGGAPGRTWKAIVRAAG